ncbi:MAG: hypothetical protein CVV47_03495 [Spirochaetae bacterium HGW-Spirochaetae-3]|jgi:hypothetical protein|nr:MAG: hypothetical protein CVV47_03495 [Spirochaetae bacterium HGW-Spirochaetae-3]
MSTNKSDHAKMDPMVKIEDQEGLDIIKNDVLKREILDAPEAIEALDRYSKILKKIEKKKMKDKASAVVAEAEPVIENTERVNHEMLGAL